MVDMSSQDIAEEILRRRPLFLLTSFHQDYECSSTETIGLFWSEQAAVLAGLRTLLTELDYNHYDPCKRFYLHARYGDEEKKWQDAWNQCIGHEHYTIKEIYPETKGGWTKSLRFDEVVKDMVILNKMPSDDVRTLLKSWRAEVLSGNIPAKLTDVAGSNRSRLREYAGCQEDWVKLYGSIAPYPYNNDTFGVDQL